MSAIPGSSHPDIWLDPSVAGHFDLVPDGDPTAALALVGLFVAAFWATALWCLL